jgi:predicted ATPase
MLTSLQLQRFKGHRDTAVSLRRITVLVGPNGAGKTSVLQALQLVGSLITHGPKEVLQGDTSPQDLLCRSGSGPAIMTLVGTEADKPWRFTLSFAHSDATSAQHVRFDWAYGKDSNQVYTDSNPRDPMGGGRRLTNEVVGLIGSPLLYRLDARRIAAVAYSTEENPEVEEDGFNTAAALATLKLEREELFEQIEAELRKIVPAIQRVRVRRVKIAGLSGEESDRIGHKVFFDFVGASDLPTHAASEGTLITLALLTALFSPNRPRLLLLDDIDQSLHPQAQMEFMRQLKRLLENFPEVQLVATTHSPYILDELEPSEVRVFAPRKDGSVACRSLSEHPQAEKMRGVLTSGQLWSLDPEWRWVLEER